MRDFVIFILLALGISWSVYYGYTVIVTKTMKSAPAQERSLEDIRKEDQQREKLQDSLKQQRQLMEDRQRTFRSHQNR
jgi:uncharacterized protein HemX